MELGLSLGSEASISPNNIRDQKHEQPQKEEEEEEEEKVQGKERVNTKEMEIMYRKEHESKRGSEVFMKEMEHNNNRIYPVQLDLLPNTPVLRTTHLHNSLLIPFPSLDGNSGVAKCSIKLATIGTGLDVKRVTDRGEEAVEGDKDVSSSPQNSTGASSFQMNLSLFNGNYNINKVDRDDRYSKRRASDQEDENNNGCGMKKLRLSQQQSAFLEESFKEHSTLNPKQKLALAKQLNLRPRQVEVWFQNRRARTKLKQTEVDCEYLRRCCETLTEENRRLHKELQELRALKNSNPFYKQLPATTLTMCPSCEKNCHYHHY